MDNQHRKIKGYRELDQDEIDLMNKIKDFGPRLESLVDEIQEYSITDGNSARWTSIGKTHLQQGLMALTRAIAKPEFF